MDRQQELAWEKRRAPQAAAAAFLGVVLGIGSIVYTQSALKNAPTPGDNVETVVAYANHPNVYIISAIAQGFSFLAVAAAMLYLDRATRFRYPKAPRFSRIVLVIGAVSATAYGITQVIIKTGDAKAALPLSDKGAEDFLREIPAAVQGVGLAGYLALGFGFALIGANAIRAGLLSRFMGYVGVALGVFTGLSALGGSVLGGPLLFFWVAALGLMYMGRWPGGRGPAWDEGEAIPWPSQQQRMKDAQEKGQGGKGGGAPKQDKPAIDPPVQAADPDTPRPASRKRKRKRKK